MPKKIAVLGGTFNPIHHGHLIVAQTIYLSQQFDEVWLMPAGRPAAKHKIQATVNDRLKMCHLASRKIDYLQLSTIEVDGFEPSYTYQTLAKLHCLYPEDSFFWVIGQDHLADLEKWRDSQKLMAEHVFVVIRRPVDRWTSVPDYQKQLDYLTNHYDFSYLAIDVPMIAISSSSIRKRRQIGQPIDFLTPKPVINYLNKKALYTDNYVQSMNKMHQEYDSPFPATDYCQVSAVSQLNEGIMSLEGHYQQLRLKARRKLRKTLDSHRYEHSLRVEQTALELALHYGLPYHQTGLAAILHDSAKCLTDKQKLALADKYNVVLTDIERKNLDLAHAKLGAIIARYNYQIDNPAILSAIAYHTTGRPAMSTLEMIVFIADGVEPGRGHRPLLDQARQVAKKSLPKAMALLLTETIDYLGQKKVKAFDPLTKETYDYYCRYK